MCFESAEWHSDVYSPLHVINDSAEISLATVTSACSYILCEALRVPPILGQVLGVGLLVAFK